MSPFFHRQPLAAAAQLLGSAVVIAGCLTSTPVRASERDSSGAEPTAAHAEAPRKSSRKAESEGKAKAMSHAPSKAESRASPTEAKEGQPPARDSLEAIRDRLAARIGAATVPATPSPGVVKVVSQTTTTRSTAAATATGAAAPTRPSAAAPQSAERPAGGATMVANAADAGRVVGASAAHAARLEGLQRQASTSMAGLEGLPWAYDGKAGPAAWGNLKPEFAACSSGARQSPIDITDGIKVELDPVQFDYRPSGFRVIDNGHTVQVNVAPGNTIEVTGKRYELIQFHFHRPSEERINGKPFDMVAHLVHRNVEGKLAVVAVLLERGSAQAVVQTVWNNLPLEKGDEVTAKGALDLSALLPTDRRYYTYMGSLTTPPCSEGVLWMVMKSPVQISPEQLAIFSRLYPMNARPIQALSGRLIKESN